MKRVLSKIIFLLLLSPLSAQLSAQSIAERKISVGIGSATCGEVIDSLEDEKDYPLSVTKRGITHWMQGYFSALSQVAAVRGTDFPDITEHESMTRWVINYCDDNPLDLVNTAVQRLYKELLIRQDTE